MFTIVKMVVFMNPVFQGGIAMAALTPRSPDCPTCWNFPTARVSARWAGAGLILAAVIIAALSL